MSWDSSLHLSKKKKPRHTITYSLLLLLQSDHVTGYLLEYKMESLNWFPLLYQHGVKDECLPPQTHLQELLQLGGHVREERMGINKVAYLRKLLLCIQLRVREAIHTITAA